jgi:hypothetical protein
MTPTGRYAYTQTDRDYMAWMHIRHNVPVRDLSDTYLVRENRLHLWIKSLRQRLAQGNIPPNLPE